MRCVEDFDVMSFDVFETIDDGALQYFNIHEFSKTARWR
jgi:hypothetical protein